MLHSVASVMTQIFYHIFYHICLSKNTDKQEGRNDQTLDLTGLDTREILTKVEEVCDPPWEIFLSSAKQTELQNNWPLLDKETQKSFQFAPRLPGSGLTLLTVYRTKRGV